MKVTLDTSAIRTIALFQQMTGANVMDYYESEDEIFFVVAEGQVGYVLGRDGIKIKKAEGRFKKRIRVFEYSGDLHEFVRRMIPEAQDISVNEGNIRVRVRSSDRSRVIGRGGIRVRAMEHFARRLHKAESFKVV